MRAILPDGPMHQRERPDLLGCRSPFPLLAARPDVVAFASEPLAADAEVVGPVEARLFVSTDARDADFHAKLVDVHPPTADDPEGFHMNLCDAILRLRFRDGIAGAAPVEPGRIYEVRIELPPTANRFKAGHRIRLDIAASSFPQYDVNPGTGERLGRHTRRIAARQAIHVGPSHRSRLILPLLPAS
jgi:putative CocE/NonD family hydrolase